MNITKLVDRDDKILKIVRSRRVLHLGCVGFTERSSEEKVAMARDSLHATISACSDCTGIDLDRETVEELRERGVFSNVLVGDVEKLEKVPANLGRFDIVLAGDIIEHLSNPGLMLDGIVRFLKEEGRLVVSTPNAFGLAGWLRFLLGRFREGSQHVVCFNSITLAQLLSRHGYTVRDALCCYQPRARASYGTLFHILRAVLARFPRFGGTLLYVAEYTGDKNKEA